MEATQLIPIPPEKYYEPDHIANLLQSDTRYQLLMSNGSFEDKITHADKYDYHRTDGTLLPKTDCLGAFLPGYEAFIVSTSHPVRQVPFKRKKRYNQPRLWAMYPEHRLGRTIKLILVSGWELVGQIEEAGQLYLGLRLSETMVVYLYRHALADFWWVGGKPPSVSKEQYLQTQRQLFDLSYTPLHLRFRPKRGQPPVPVPVQPAPPPVESMKLLSEAMKEKAERTMINAKLRIVLREIPTTLRELGDIVWIPLENQPGSLPKGIELSTVSVDLVVSKKMWANTQKKAQELKQTVPNVLYIFEAVIGSFQNRLAAVASGVQVLEAKPKAK